MIVHVQCVGNSTGTDVLSTSEVPVNEKKTIGDANFSEVVDKALHLVIRMEQDRQETLHKLCTYVHVHVLVRPPYINRWCAGQAVRIPC